MRKPEKIADAIRLLCHQAMRKGDTATVSVGDLATATKLSEAEVREIVTHQAGLVWAKLPMGWMLAVDDLIHIIRRSK